MNLLEYPITRPITLSHWKIALIIVGALAWSTIITVISVAAVGYELIPQVSTDYNATYSAWYENFGRPLSSLLPKTWSCDPSIIKLNEGIVPYSLLGYLDVRNNTPVDGLSYVNTPLTSCEVALINLVQSESDGGQNMAWISCNTSAQQSVLLGVSSSREGFDASNFDAVPLDFPTSNGGFFNFTSIAGLWFAMLQNVLDIVAPDGLNSILLPSAINNNLTSIRVAFYGNSYLFPKPNTPASDSWFIYLAYTTSETPAETRIPIAFLPTGEIDSIHTTPGNLTAANNILTPTIGLLRAITGDNSFDSWKLLNWLFVGHYWVLLADLGQVAPTAYDLTIPGNPQPITYPSTNNVFVNETLYNIYSNYINETIRPLLHKFRPNRPSLPSILLNDATRLQSRETTFLRTYSCSKRQKKVWISMLISVIAADYALIGGAYKLLLFLLGWYNRRKDEGDSSR